MYLFLCKFNISFIIERKESDINLLHRTDRFFLKRDKHINEKRMNNIKYM